MVDIFVIGGLVGMVVGIVASFALWTQSDKNDKSK